MRLSIASLEEGEGGVRVARPQTFEVEGRSRPVYVAEAITFYWK
jgi:hypothetical protein